MSSIDVDVGPHAAEHAWINSIDSISAAVLLYYDYLLTLPREILYLWPPHNKQGWFTAACLLNRYVPVLGHIPVVVSYFIPMNTRLPGSSYVPRMLRDGRANTRRQYVCPTGLLPALIFVIYATDIALCMVRVHALWGRSRYILGLLLAAGTMSILTASAALIASSRVGGETLPVISGFAGCSHFTPTVGALFIMNLANILTLRYSPVRCHAIPCPAEPRFYTWSFSQIQPMLRTATTTYTNVLSTTLVSRLVLNLRERNSTLAGLPTTMESERGFQAALPAAQQAVASVGNIPSVQQNKSICETAVGGVGTSR
ncbi:hypothetical protein BC826DRAFT_1106593 [Russula brevipes]|nr:hypothetical protein BC826DRAFT_1106593 [Russula brevipes]